MADAKQCPWCKQWALKDRSCNYIFACGLDDNGTFHKGGTHMSFLGLVA